MNECDVCGPHDGPDYTGTITIRRDGKTATADYHLCEAHYIAS